MVQSGAYERPLDYLPERDIYEALCRGEGVKMVRERQGFSDCLCIRMIKLADVCYSVTFFRKSTCNSVQDEICTLCPQLCLKLL